MEFYTVLFGVSRAFGVAAQLIWDRALGARAYISACLSHWRNGSYHSCSAGTSQIVLHCLHSEDICQQELIGLPVKYLTFGIPYGYVCRYTLSHKGRPDLALFPRSLDSPPCPTCVLCSRPSDRKSGFSILTRLTRRPANCVALSAKWWSSRRLLGQDTSGVKLTGGTL